MSSQQVELFIRQSTAKMVKHIREKYSAPSFEPRVVVSFSQHRTTSRGGIRRGKPFINIVAKRFLAAAISPSGKMDELEYKSFNRDPIIGGLYNVPWQKALASLGAHELAHAVQYDGTTKVGAKRVLGVEELDDRNEILRGHDWFWKQIYAELRTQFVNGDAFDQHFSGSSQTTQPPSAPQPTTVEPRPVEPVKLPSPGALYVKYRYKGNATYSEFYVDNKLRVVIAEIDRKFYRADLFGGESELLPYKTLVEARKNLIGQ